MLYYPQCIIEVGKAEENPDLNEPCVDLCSQQLQDNRVIKKYVDCSTGESSIKIDAGLLQLLVMGLTDPYDSRWAS